MCVCPALLQCFQCFCWGPSLVCVMQLVQCLVFNPDGGGPGVLSVTLSLVFLLFVSLLESSVVGFLCLVVQKFRV